MLNLFEITSKNNEQYKMGKGSHYHWYLALLFCLCRETFLLPPPTLSPIPLPMLLESLLSVNGEDESDIGVENLVSCDNSEKNNKVKRGENDNKAYNT